MINEILEESLYDKVKQLEKENSELKSQIERMMCCANCKHHKKNELIRVGNDVLCHKNKKCDYWEFGE